MEPKNIDTEVTINENKSTLSPPSKLGDILFLSLVNLMNEIFIVKFIPSFLIYLTNFFAERFSSIDKWYKVFCILFLINSAIFFNYLNRCPGQH